MKQLAPPLFPWLAFSGILTIVLFSAFAYTAANTVPATQAGEGSGAITGYIISNISYSLNATNPINIDTVQFSLDSTPPTGSTMKIQLFSGGTWYSCTNSVADLTCDTTVGTQATVDTVTSLDVVVAQ